MSAMPAPIRQRFELHARLSAHRAKVRRSQDMVAGWLSKTTRRYVSLSGGKDSTCALALVREQAPGTPAVYWDADCAFPEVSHLINTTPDCIRFPTDEPFLDTLARFGAHGGADLENATMRTTVYGPVRRWLAQSGCDGAAYGLRQEESRGRRMLGQVRGGVFWSAQYEVWMCQPVTHWSYSDVWAYIVSHDLPYAGTYDRMWEMPEREQRISYWAGETNRQNGRWAWLKRNYPELFAKLCEVLPDARSYT